MNFVLKGNYCFNGKCNEEAIRHRSLTFMKHTVV